MPEPMEPLELEPDAVLEPRRKVSKSSRTLAWLLDDLIRIPGTDIGIGLDGLIGLIPGVGDASTTTMAGLILADAVRNRVPLPVLARMGVNLGIDALLGLVPAVGDLVDVAHRANRKNLRLLQASVNNREETRQHAVIYLIVALSLVVGTLVFLVAVLLWSLWLIWRLLTGG